MFAKVIPPQDFARRRQILMERMEKGAIALIPAAPEAPRNRDVQYPYRQDSDFYYLTGFPEPEAVAVLTPGHEHEFSLFCRERDPQMETWHGRRAGQQGAVERYGANNAHPITEIDKVLPGLLENRQRVFYSIGYNPTFDRRVMDWVNQVRAKARAGVRAPGEFIALEHLLHDMRLRKEASELAVMREAGRISAEAHCRAMGVCKPGLREYEIEAEILYTFTRHGAGWAYPAIVAGGGNACILHYTDNSAVLQEGDLLLIDAGGEVDGYAADITRTFPINGRFSPEQRALYEVVLAAQQAAIAKVKPVNRFNEFHEAALRVLTEGLVELGLLSGDPSKLIEEETYKRFYMHRTGHWLGMDVHDVGDYKVGEDWRILEPGMVTTVEPGLYIPAGSEGVDERWWGIGIRIEDDVLVTEQGNEVLTSAVPKDPDAIERFMADDKR
jgi:Xaa-Pro aminopeptidase